MDAAAEQLFNTGTEEDEDMEQLEYDDSDDWGGEASQDEAEEEEEEETDPARLLQRQKQIDYGKNTIGYERYIVAVPKKFRKKKGKDMDPPTPDIKKKLAKRTWDGIVKVWRRHLHKFEDMDVATAEAKAEELKVKVLAARAAKAEALGLPVKTKTAPADQAKRAGKRDKERRRRLATLARQQRQEQQQRQEPKPVAPAAYQQLLQQPGPLAQPPQQQQKAQPASKLSAQPQQRRTQQQQQRDKVFDMKVFSSRELGSADRRERNTRSRLSATGDRQDHSREQQDRIRDREGRYAAGYGGSGAWDQRELGERGSDRAREEERGHGSDRDRVYGTGGRDYSRRSSDDRRHKDRFKRYESHRDSAADQSNKWQQVGERSRHSHAATDKENSQGSWGARRGHDNKADYEIRSSRYNRADAASAAAAVAAAVNGLACGSGRDGAGRYSTSSKLDHPSSSRHYSSLRQQFNGSRGGMRGGAQSDGSDSDAPSPMRRQPVSLLSDDPMEWGDGTPSCPQRTQRQHPSWADDVEAAEALCNVCEVMMVQSDQEEGEILEENIPADRAATRPRSASMTPAKRTAACLG